MKTIRWGMIGCGAVTETKSGPGLYKSRNSMLLAVTSMSLPASQDYAARHGVERVYVSAEELVRDPDIDAVYIATPPATHKALALLAARAGKHVYVEKPMAMHYDECQEIIDQCNAKQVKLFVAFYRRAMPRFQQVKQWLDSNTIGKVSHVLVLHRQPPAPEDLSRATLPWRLLPEVSGGGKFVDMGVHTLDILDYWFGRISEVRGLVDNLAHLYDVEDTVAASWTHAQGIRGFGHWDYVGSDDVDRVEIIGSAGRIELEFFTDTPLKLFVGDSLTEIDIPNPEHVQQPFIQSIVDELNGTDVCPGNVASAAHANWIIDEILKDYRSQRGL